jgi:hypothetical protein
MVSDRSDDTLYLNGGTLLALTPEGGPELERKISGSSFLAPSVGRDGTIYVPAKS